MRLSVAVFLLALLAHAPLAQEVDQPSAADPVDELTSLSLEDLMQVEITSVSKKLESISGAAAAITVITAEDIRRSGATSIPEALRLVPGVFVARIDSNKWAVTARGFNDRLANKLLVLIDGRSVYTPLFSGVYWEFHDVMLEDIDRIEVIRGPGATLWGANAVNGVINIITKKAQDTQGGLISGGGGTYEQGFGSARYGGALGDDAFYRVYLKYLNRDELEPGVRGLAGDDWDMLRGGARLDWNLSERDTLTLSADAFGGTLGGVYTLPEPYEPYWRFEETEDSGQGADFVARWTRTLENDGSLSAQFYYDYYERDHFTFHERRDILDWEFQHRFQAGSHNEIVWGLGYRLDMDELEDSFDITFNPDDDTFHLFSAFIQDEITLVPDRLRLILGSKFEHNDYTGFEFQPNARLSWTPHEDHAIWASVSRAVRTPSRGEHGLDVFRNGRVSAGDADSPIPLIGFITGNENFQSEELIAYETGYRALLTDWLLIDAALFYHDYDRLRIAVFGDLIYAEDNGRPFFNVLSPLVNDLEAEAYGFELSTTVSPIDWMQWKFAYTLFYNDVEYQGDIVFNGEEEFDERVSPEHQLSWLTTMNLTKDVELDLWLRYVDELPVLNYSDFLSDSRIPSNLTVDVRLGWTPVGNFELSLVGQNLADDSRREFFDSIWWITNPTQVGRSFYAKATWRF